MHETLSLFAPEPALQRLPMRDADVRFMEGFYRNPQSGQTMQHLLDETPWKQETIVIAGQERLQPRLSAWHGDAGCSYVYSGTRFEPHPWTPSLLRIRDDIETLTGHRFNSVLINLYRNENDSIGWHSDAEPELGVQPVIASLSLGETRIFKFRHKTRKDERTVSIALNDGSLLLMAGTTQRYWQHAIAKEHRPQGMRINLTFRQIRTETR